MAELHEPGDVRSKVQHRGHGHVCPDCEGKGTRRVRGLPGYAQVPCQRCGGSGALRAS